MLVLAEGFALEIFYFGITLVSSNYTSMFISVVFLSPKFNLNKIFQKQLSHQGWNFGSLRCTNLYLTFGE